jgi:predicted small lipoprotein YifL
MGAKIAAKIQAKPRPTGIPAHRQGVGGSVYSGAIMLYYKDSTMKRLFTALIAMLAVSTLLVGCGQKGPLFLPEESQPVPAQAEPAAEPAQTE